MGARPRRNYNVFLASNALFAVVMGVFTPYWIVFLQEFGSSIHSFGIAVGLMSLAQSVTAYYAGKHSDRLGRKPLMLLGGFIFSVTILLYAFITEIWQLYVLQVINGIAGAIVMLMDGVFLADITERTTRGADIGRFHMITGVLGAVALMLSGFVIVVTGLRLMLVLVAFFIAISTAMLFAIREESFPAEK